MKIGILGTGAYGIALASVLVDNNDITMWTKFEEEKELIESKRMYDKVLPNVKIDERINVSTDINDSVLNKDIVIICIPVKFINDIIPLIKNLISNQVILIASKGILDNGLFISDLLKEKLNYNRIAVIAGGTFAIDMVKKENMGLTIAGEKEEIDIVKEAFKSDYLMIDELNNIISVELMSSIKNVYAIMFGILDELKCNESTKALYFKRMLNEIVEFVIKIGGDSNDILSFSGIGDIYLTCTSSKSRNYSFGKVLVNKSIAVNDYLSNNTVEGVNTLKSIKLLEEEKKIELNLINRLYEIVFNNNDVKNILK